MKQNSDENCAKKPIKSASEKAMDYLAIRDHSEKELRTKLHQKGYKPEEIDHAISYCWKYNFLLPPEELAEKITHLLHQKGKGIHYIQRYLSKKGLPFCGFQEDFEVEKALKQIYKKLSWAPPFSFEEKVKLNRFLKNRGYDPQTVNKVINYEQ